MQIALVPGNTNETVVRALIEALKVKGWTLRAIGSELQGTGTQPVASVDEAIELMAGWEVSVLDFHSSVGDGRSHYVFVDSLLDPEETIKRWEWDDTRFNTLVKGFVATVPALLLSSVPDLGLDAVQLRVKYTEQGEHPTYIKDDWKWEVSTDGTLIGYWDWVLGNLEANAE